MAAESRFMLCLYKHCYVIKNYPHFFSVKSNLSLIVYSGRKNLRFNDGNLLTRQKKKTQIVERNGGISHPSNNETVTKKKKRKCCVFSQIRICADWKKERKNAEIRWTITSSLMCCSARKLCLFHFVHTHTPLNQVLCVFAPTQTH